MQNCVKLWSLCFVLLAVPAARAVSQPCPWLNAATAAGVLGGPVAVSVTYVNQDNTDGACEFTTKGSPAMRTLRIEVETMKDLAHDFPRYLAKCGQDAQALKAIGNEAVMCAVPRKNGRLAEQVVSRVRERAFTVAVVSSGSTVERDMSRDKARRIAEQVAGFLF